MRIAILENHIQKRAEIYADIQNDINNIDALTVMLSQVLAKLSNLENRLDNLEELI